jgi:uncharacterized protein (DUF608 family)
MSRRTFFGAAGAVGATLAYASAPTASAQDPAGALAASGSAGAPTIGLAEATGPVAIPSTISMGSGAPLGGIGTGFLEIRPDGCFHEWQILNQGAWAGRRSRGRASGAAGTPPNLRFLVRTGKPGDGSPQLRRLYLRNDENDLYSLGYVQDIEAIEYDAWYPMTTLRYRDATLPLRISAVAFSPFMPGKARESATPGFHFVFTLENTSRETVEASLLSVLDNPIVSTIDDRKLSNTLRHDGASTSLLLESAAQPEDKSDLGSLCLSVTGGEHSWISGTFGQFALPGLCNWASRRVNAMRLDLLQDYFKTGRLPNTETATDPSQGFSLSDAQIDALSGDQLKGWLSKLRGDALLNRVIADFQAGDPSGSDNSLRALLKEIRANFDGGLAGADRHRSSWGTGALASAVTLRPGEKVEVRFTLGWFFPNHVAGRSEIGHIYANWFKNAAEVNQFLGANYAGHREVTEKFARTLLDTTLGTPLAFVWSSQLGTLVKNTWWSKAGHFAVWEGLGCCGLSTTDVDFDGSSSNVALFPELKLGQMKHIIKFQNERGQVPHNYATTFDRVDRGFDRVDMNPQFVMMACRDYLWTGDKDYLVELYPHLVKAMDYIASLDSDGDGLPDRNTGFQTYDQWGMRGAPSYIASLWIGSLKAAIRMARDLGNSGDVERWQATANKASASFDRVLFNGEYYSLWVDGATRDEICMTDQISGEWFSHLLGLPTTISQKNLAKAVAAILKNNFSPEIGVDNATAPKGGRDVAAVNNLQAGGVWSGIEFAFASFLMDHGWYLEGARIVEAVHRRYLRAGMPWNHVECGGHYTRAMSSWTTLLAATGFKPDWPAQTLRLLPTAPGDFRAPWVTASGFGAISRSGGTLTIDCQSGSLGFKRLQVNVPGTKPAVRLAGRSVSATVSREDGLTTLEFAQPISIHAGQSCAIG